MKGNLKILIYTALMTAFVFITTTIIKIPIPFTNGYIHAGDMCIFISGILLGPWYGAFAAGVGSAFADFFGGYAFWVIPTFIIKSIMGFVIGYFASEDRNLKHFVRGAMGIWLVALIGFIYTVKNTSLTQLVDQVDEVTSLQFASEVVNKLNTQLLVVAVGLPLLSFLLYKLKSKYGVSLNQLVGMLVAGIWMVLGYYIAAGIMYGNMIAPIFSIPWNIVQFGVGAILAFMITSGLNKANINFKTLHSKR